MRTPSPALPRFWHLQLAGWTLYGLALVITFLPMIPSEGGSVLRLLEIKGVRALLGLTLSSLLRLGYRRLAPGSPLARQAAWALAGSALLGTVWALLGDTYASLRNASFDWGGAHARLPRTAFDYAATLLGWSALYFGLKQARASQAAREQALKADALAQAARLTSLRHQLQPHFLFNALGSIRALVEEDPVRARRVVTEVADFLRFSLVEGSRASVPLAEELAMVRSYLAIEAVRFEEKLQVRFEVQPGVETCRVPAFLLQPLVDNAVKHGMASGSLPVQVTVRAQAHGDTLRLEVGNTGTWAPGGCAGTGTGLRNVQERLEALHPGRASLEHHAQDGQVQVVVQLPVVLPPQEETHARALGG
jgi:two-component system, LytTR family, sensor kinase